MLSIVIPTYNEKDNIEPLVHSIHETLSQLDTKYEVVIVDDDSPDGTADEARRMAASYPLSVVVRKDQRGLATAVIRGFSEAKGDIIAVMDADLSHQPRYLADMYQAIMTDGADMTIGSRFVPGGGSEDWSRWRGFVSWVARMIGRGLSPIKDLTSGFFMFRREVIEGAKLNPFGYKIGLEILAKGRIRKVVEVPIIFYDRTHGQSKLGWKTTLAYFYHLARLYWWIVFQAGSSSDVGQTITFARFSLVGMSGILVNYGLFLLFRHLLAIPHLMAAALAIEISIISNFLLNHFWTWRHRPITGTNRFIHRAIKYHLVAGIAAFGGNWGTLYVLADVFGWNIDISYFLGIGVGMLVNFFLNDRWTFARDMWKVNHVSG